MDKDAVTLLAKQLHKGLQTNGISALERFDWSEKLLSLGFKMDCGDSFKETYNLSLGDSDGLKNAYHDIKDIQVLGNAIFSECRYLTHWSMDAGENEFTWLMTALSRLEEIAN